MLTYSCYKYANYQKYNDLQRPTVVDRKLIKLVLY